MQVATELNRTHNAVSFFLFTRPWQILVALCAIVFIALELYDPASTGPFTFDDEILPFSLSRFDTASLKSWISGNRPMLMFSYWLNAAISGRSVAGFHHLNVIIHATNALLVFLIIRRLLSKGLQSASVITAVSAFCGMVFLVHPLQTESVAYIAGRSECLSALFFLSAYFCFLKKTEGGISYRSAAAIALFYGLAVLTKEHTAVLPAVLLLTDYFWTTPFTFEGIRRNWRLYAPLAILAAAGVAMVARVLFTSQSAGFGMQKLTWQQYAMTQPRAILGYLRLIFWPAGQSADHDMPLSTTLVDPVTALSIAGLAGMIAAALFFRKRFPLASLGVLMALVVLAPTSSFVPIADPFVERRAYLPMVGFVIAVAALIISITRYRKFGLPAAVAVLVVLSVLTYSRNQLWANPYLLWRDTVQTSPVKVRPYTQLARSAVRAGACDDAAPFILAARDRSPNDYHLQLASGTILECQKRFDEAMAALTRAAELRRSSEVYELIGLLHGSMGNSSAARQALETAIEIDPRSFSAHYSMALWYEAAGDEPGAIRCYRRVLELEPNHHLARTNLRALEHAAATRKPGTTD